MEGTCVNRGLLAVGDMCCGNCGQQTSVAAAAPASADWPNSRAGRAGGGGGAGSGRRTGSSWVPGWFYDKVPEGSFDPLGNSRLPLPGRGL